MSNNFDKKEIGQLLKAMHAQIPDIRVTIADAVHITTDDQIKKFPVKKCVEEAYVLGVLKDIGIPTPEIVETGEMTIGKWTLPFYAMKRIKHGIDIITHGDQFLTDKYYAFLKNVITGLRTIKLEGFGAIRLVGGKPQTDFSSEQQFFRNIIARIQKREYWPPAIIDGLYEAVDLLRGCDRGVLVHTDILNNVLFDKNKGQFYLIDPQTIVSSANEYWDLSLYMIYANGYGCLKGLVDFVKEVRIEDWERFLITAKINAYERISFYNKYDSSRLHGMTNFLDHLFRGQIAVGEISLSRNEV